MIELTSERRSIAIEELVVMASELVSDGASPEYLRAMAELLASAAGLEMSGGREAMARRISPALNSTEN